MLSSLVNKIQMLYSLIVPHWVGKRYIRDVLNILLEGVPEGINGQAVKQAIKQMPGVLDVDDLHIWALSSQYAALSAHVIIQPCSLEKSIELVEQIKKELNQKFNILHTTLETHLAPHRDEGGI